MQPGNETAVCFPNSSSRICCRGAKPYRAEPIVLAILLEGAFTLTYPGSGPVMQGVGKGGHKLEGCGSKLA